MSELTHFDQEGQAHMVDVGAKAETHRIARASGRIYMAPSTLELVKTGTAKKGDVLGVARIAAIMASVPPQVTTISLSGSIGRFHFFVYMSARASRKFFAPNVIEYW